MTGMFKQRSGGSWVPQSPAHESAILFERTTDLTLNELRYEQLVAGTFTCRRTTEIFDVSINGIVDGLANVLFFLYVGQPVTPGTSLYDVAGAPISGAVVKSVGGIGYDTGSGTTSSRVAIPNLVVGETVTFQIIPAIIGGAVRYPSVDLPTCIAVLPNGEKMFVAKTGSGSLQPFKLNPSGHGAALGLGALEQSGWGIPTGIQPRRICVTNFVGVVINLFSGTISTFDPVNELWLRDTAVTGAIGVGLNNAGTTAYATTNLGTVVPITISTGTAGSALAVGAGSDDILDVCLNSAETKLFACNYDTSVVRVVTLPSTIGASISVTGKPVRIRRAPVSNEIWVLTEAGGPSSVAMMKKIDPATDTVVTTINLPYTGGVDFAVMSGGTTAFVAFTGGKFCQVMLSGEFAGQIQTNHQGNLAYSGGTYSGLVGGVAVDALDSIYYSLSDVDEIFKFPGARLRFYYNNSFYGTYARVVVR